MTQFEKNKFPRKEEKLFLTENYWLIK